MMFDDDDCFSLLQQQNDEPPAEDEDLRKRGLNFIGKDGPRREAASSSIARLSAARPSQFHSRFLI